MTTTAILPKIEYDQEAIDFSIPSCDEHNDFEITYSILGSCVGHNDKHGLCSIHLLRKAGYYCGHGMGDSCFAHGSLLWTASCTSPTETIAGNKWSKDENDLHELRSGLLLKVPFRKYACKLSSASTFSEIANPISRYMPLTDLEIGESLIIHAQEMSYLVFLSISLCRFTTFSGSQINTGHEISVSQMPGNVAIIAKNIPTHAQKSKSYVSHKLSQQAQKKTSLYLQKQTCLLFRPFPPATNPLYQATIRARRTSHLL
jgi:hypothetical protein